MDKKMKVSSRMDIDEQRIEEQNNEARRATEITAPDLKKLQEILDRIVFRAEEAAVVALSGAWGEGKTFFWKQAIAKRYATEKSGYVSVFGAESIQEIRERVVFEALSKPRWRNSPKLAAIPSVLNDYTKRLGWLGNALNWIGRKASGVFMRWPEMVKTIFAPNRLAIQLVEDNVLQGGWVLCIDDIERLSTTVNMDALMGYISELRDERQVKVVLIYNRERLGDNNAVFENFHEKVIDRELPFIPEIRDALRLVFSETQLVVDNNELVEELARRCCVLSLKNIRLLTKTRHYYEEVLSIFTDDADEEFLKSVLFSLLLFVWIRYAQKADELPDFEFLSGYSSVGIHMKSHLKNREQDLEEETLRATKLLDNYGYEYTDDLDNLLIAFVRTDVLDNVKLLEEHKKYQRNISQGQREKRYTAVWKQHYHGSLQDNEDVFCEELISATVDFMDSIELNNFDAVLCKLSRLGRNDDAQRLLGEFVSKRGGDLQNFDERFLLQRIEYPDLDSSLGEAKQRALLDERSIDEVIKDLLTNEFLSRENMKRLSEFTVEDFVTYFTSSDRESLTLTMRHLCNSAKHTGFQEEYVEKLQRVLHETVEIIAGQCLMNRLRMESMELIDCDEVNQS